MDRKDCLQLLSDMAVSLDSWRWIPIEEKLPPMFTNVIVFGCIAKLNICNQPWMARRWTGWTSGWEGISEGKEPPWEWVGLHDRRIAKVTHWMPLPSNRPYKEV